MNFELPLAQEKVNRQQKIALHLIIGFTLMFTGFFLLLFQSWLQNLPTETAASLMNFTVPKIWGWTFVVSGLSLLFVSITKNKWLLESKTNLMIKIAELFTLLLLAGFALLHEFFTPAVIYGVIAAAIIFSIYWENAGSDTLFIHVDEKGIRLPVTSRKRSVAWWEIEQVLYRYGILTIDCHDNRLFQWNIKTDDFDKDNFKQFCEEQIIAGKEKRKKSDW